VVIPPPSACVAPIAWDIEFDPAGLPAEELARSWARRADALIRAEAMLDCVRGWADDMDRLARREEEARARRASGGR